MVNDENNELKEHEELLDDGIIEEEGEPEHEETQDEESEDEKSDDDFDPDVDTMVRQVKAAAKYKRDNYRLLAENQKLQEQLKQTSSQGDYDYYQMLRLQQDKIHKDLMEAKADIALAAQENDNIKLAEAQARVAEVTAAKLQFERETANFREEYEQYGNTSPEPMEQYDGSGLGQYQKTAMQNWLEENEDINPQSSRVVPELYQAVAQYGMQLDNVCIKNGQAHLIGSPEYQDALDQYAAQCRAVYYKTSKAPQASTGRSSSSVLPVRGRSAASGSSKHVKLSKADYDFVRENHLDIDDYIKYNKDV